MEIKELYNEIFKEYMELKNTFSKMSQSGKEEDVNHYVELDKSLQKKAWKLSKAFPKEAKQLDYLDFKSQLGFLSEYGKLKDLPLVDVEVYKQLPPVYLVKYVSELEEVANRKSAQLKKTVDDLARSPELETLKRQKRALNYTLDSIQYDLEQIDEALEAKKEK